MLPIFASKTRLISDDPRGGRACATSLMKSADVRPRRSRMWSSGVRPLTISTSMMTTWRFNTPRRSRNRASMPCAMYVVCHATDRMSKHFQYGLALYESSRRAFATHLLPPPPPWIAISLRIHKRQGDHRATLRQLYVTTRSSCPYTSPDALNSHWIARGHSSTIDQRVPAGRSLKQGRPCGGPHIDTHRPDISKTT